MAGVSLVEQGVTEEIVPPYTSVKESVFPFSRFHGVDIILGPEMRSTGEVMGIDEGFPIAFAKSQIAAGAALPSEGTVFVSMATAHKAAIVEPARRLRALGFHLLATGGTAAALQAEGIEVRTIRKVQEGRPNLLDAMANGEVQLVFNTPSGKGARTDEGKIRAAAVSYGVPCVTTLPGCVAVVAALEALAENPRPARPGAARLDRRSAGLLNGVGLNGDGSVAYAPPARATGAVFGLGRGERAERDAVGRLREDLGQRRPRERRLDLGERVVHPLVERAQPHAVRRQPERAGRDPADRVDGVHDRQRRQPFRPLGERHPAADAPLRLRDPAPHETLHDLGEVRPRHPRGGREAVDGLRLRVGRGQPHGDPQGVLDGLAEHGGVSGGRERRIITSRAPWTPSRTVAPAR